MVRLVWPLQVVSITEYSVLFTHTTIAVVDGNKNFADWLVDSRDVA